MKTLLLQMIAFLMWFSGIAIGDISLESNVIDSNEPTVNMIWSYADAHRTTISFELSKRETGIDGLIDCQSIVVSIDNANNLVERYIGQNVCELFDNERFLVTTTFNNKGRPSSNNETIQVSFDFSKLRWIPNTTFNGQNITPIEKIENFGFHTELVTLLKDIGDLSFVGDSSIEDNSVKLTLSRIYVNPTFTQVNSCIDLPDNRDWIPDASLVGIDGKEIRYSYWILLDYKNPQVQNGTSRCYEFFFRGNFFKDAYGKNLRFVLSEIKTSLPDNFADLSRFLDLNKPILQNKGIDYHLQRGEQSHEIVIDDKPSHLTVDEALALVLDSMIDKVSGKWGVSWK